MWQLHKRKQKKNEIESSFLENGGALLKELVSFTNGRYKIPIRSFTVNELISATNNFIERVDREYICMYKGSIDDRLILVKKFNDEDINSHTFDGVIRDIVITSQMSHLKNVFKLIGCCLEFKHPALVYQFLQFELLSDLLYKPEKLLSWESRMNIAIGIANAVLYLHTGFSTPVIYRDLNTSNVIIDDNGVAKLFDFSTSISLPPGELLVEDDIRGTIGFIDPEYLISGVVSQKIDVYSFGVFLLVLFTGQKSSIRKNTEGERINIVDYVKDHIEKDELNRIIDPVLNEVFDDKRKFEGILDLAMRCTQKLGQDRLEMLDVAKELRQIALK